MIAVRPSALRIEFIAVLLTLLLNVIGEPSAAQPEAAFVPPARDSGVDQDGDTQFDFLRVEVDVDVLEVGAFYLSATLYSSDGMTYIDALSANRYMDQDDEVVFDFPASEILREGLDGPYRVSLSMRNESFVVIDWLNHTTSAYPLAAFDQLPLAFVPPHSDVGIDTDGDGRYDVLQVRLNVDATAPGSFRFYAEIPAGPPFWRIEVINEVRDLVPGLQVVALNFTGWKLWAGYDGPYDVTFWSSALSGTHRTANYLRTDFDRPPVSFSPPHWDEAIDAIGDAAFDVLRVHVNVTVDQPSRFFLTAYLRDSGGAYVAHAYRQENLDVSAGAMTVDFRGSEIRAAERDGPYLVELEGRIGDGLTGQQNHTTTAYLATDFARFEAVLAPPHGERPVDIDGDGLFDYLEVQVYVNVSAPGHFRVHSFVYGVGDGFASAWLLPGRQHLDILYSGHEVRKYQPTGPFTVRVRTIDPYGSAFEEQEFQTRSYDWQQFEPPPFSFAPPHTDSAMDDDGDGLYDFLRVFIQVNTSKGGRLSVVGRMFRDYAEVGSAHATTNLPPGTGTVELQFRGWLIRELGLDGPFRVDFYALLGDQGFSGGSHVTGAYRAVEFAVHPARLAPPHLDAAIDSNSDGIYEKLRVQVRLDVTRIGIYRIAGRLYDSYFQVIADSVSETVVTPGNVTVPLDFAGSVLRAKAHDGVFLVHLFITDAVGYYLDWDQHVSGRYTAAAFGPPATTRFTPPHTDAGIDTDGDGLYNSIRIDIEVFVSELATYEVSVSLAARGGGALWTEQRTLQLGEGANHLQTEVSTFPMVVGAVDGPYVASFAIYPEDDNYDWPTPLDWGSHSTLPYLVTQFDPIPVVFEPPHAAVALDRDLPSDGLADSLQVLVRLQARDAASVRLAGTVWDGTRAIALARASQVLSLAPGVHVAPLYFAGILIRTAGVDGPYYLTLSLAPDYPVYAAPFARDGFVTPSFLATAFEPLSPAWVNGTVRAQGAGGIVPSPDVTAYNYEDGLGSAVYGVSLGLGEYNLSLYEDDWVLVYDHEDYQSALVPTTARSPSLIQDVSLGPLEADSHSLELTFPTWDRMDVRETEVRRADASTARQSIDWWHGNRDGFLTWPEFNVSLAFGYPAKRAIGPWTFDLILVDGVFYELVPGTETERYFDVEGPMDDPRPIWEEEVGVYSANSTVAPAEIHQVSLRVGFDRWKDGTYKVRFPPGFVVASIVVPPGTSVMGQGTDTLTVDPGPDPSLYDELSAFWMTLIVAVPGAVPPTIDFLNVTPDPVELGESVTISASVSDDVGVATVDVEIRGPAGGVEERGAMSPTGGGAYDFVFTPGAVGAYAFVITAQDGGGNRAVRSGAFTVMDSVQPILGTPVASPNPGEYNATVRFSVSATDLGGIASAVVEVRDSAGTPLTNLEMSRVGTSNEFEAFSTFAVLATLTYAVVVVDGSGNLASASGSLTVRDTTPPLAHAGPDLSVLVGDLVSFDGGGSVDNHAVVRFTWTFSEDGNLVTLDGIRFSHRFVRPGVFVITLTAADPSGNEGTDAVRVHVSPTTGAISGRVVDGAGAPVAGAQVTLLRGRVPIGNATAAADGGFELQHVSPGTYVVRAEALGFRPGEQVLEVQAGRTVDVTISLLRVETLGPSWLPGVLLLAASSTMVVGFLLVRKRKKRRQTRATKDS